MKKILFLVVAVLIVGALFYWSTTGKTQDKGPPTVISTDPSNGARNVSPDASIHVYFSEPMDPSTITTDTFIVTDSDGAQVPGEVTYVNNAAAFVHFTHMDEISTYTATISGSVTDEAGNALGSDYSWSFETAAK